MGYRWKREVELSLKRIEDGLGALTRGVDKAMSKLDDMQATLKQIDDFSNAIAAKLQAVMDQLKGGLTPQEADRVIAGLQVEADKLRALAADPANPVPTP